MRFRRVEVSLERNTFCAASNCKKTLGKALNAMLKRILKLRELVIFICVLVTALVFYLIQPGATNRFLTPDNLKAILIGLAPDGLIAIGMTFVIITGGFDLSVGSTLALGGFVAGGAFFYSYDTTLALAPRVFWCAVLGPLDRFFLTTI